VPVLAPQQNRPAGEHESSEVAAPARGNDEATDFIITLNPVTADLNDASLIVDTTLEGSIDGTNWVVFAKIEGWQGGSLGHDGQVRPPNLSWSATDNRTLTKVRVRWTQNKSARIGVSMDFAEITVNRQGV